MAKGRAIHRPTGWIRSYRSKVLGLVEGKMTINEYVAFDVLLHIGGWDKTRPDYGKVERNISRMQREWFPFWSRPMLIKQLSALKEKLYIEDDGETISIPNFRKYQGVEKEKGVTPVTPEDDQTVTPVTGGVTPVTETVTPVTLSVTPVTVNLVNSGTTSELQAPLKNNKKEEQPTKNMIPLTPPPGESRFDRFWTTYPKKVGKGAARKALERIKPNDDLLAKMLTAIERQALSDQWTKDGGRFIPNPSTWLNQERWDDELKTPSKEVKIGSNQSERSGETSTGADAADINERLRRRSAEMLKLREDNASAS